LSGENAAAEALGNKIVEKARVLPLQFLQILIRLGESTVSDKITVALSGETASTRPAAPPTGATELPENTIRPFELNPIESTPRYESPALLRPSAKLLGVDGRFTGVPAEKVDDELVLPIGTIRVVQDNVVPLHAEVVTNVVVVVGAELLVTWNVSEVVGYTGIEGLNPPLQVGGVQAAVIATFPAAEAPTVATLPNTELDPPTTLTDCGEEEAQVSGTAVSGMPTVSVTTALTVADPPGAMSERDVPGASCKEMDCTGQVVN
jgi:hypothetical protein